MPLDIAGLCRFEEQSKQQLAKSLLTLVYCKQVVFASVVQLRILGLLHCVGYFATIYE